MRAFRVLFPPADPGSNRYSLAFTLRDSPADFVNVTCWGNDSFINDLAKSFKINDVGMFGICSYLTHACVSLVPLERTSSIFCDHSS